MGPLGPWAVNVSADGVFCDSFVSSSLVARCTRDPTMAAKAKSVVKRVRKTTTNT